jgi:hypothetical protein
MRYFTLLGSSYSLRALCSSDDWLEAYNERKKYIGRVFYLRSWDNFKTRVKKLARICRWMDARRPTATIAFEVIENECSLEALCHEAAKLIPADKPHARKMAMELCGQYWGGMFPTPQALQALSNIA